MITLGIILIILGIFFSHLLLVLGVVLLICGVIAGGFGHAGHTLGGRRHWY